MSSRTKSNFFIEGSYHDSVLFAPAIPHCHSTLSFRPELPRAADTGDRKPGYLAVTLTAIALSWLLYHWRIFAW
jgi:hypothetical protein